MKNSFLQAYIRTALWSSNEHPFAECPCCGETRLLSHYPEPEYEQTPVCSADGCGVREIPNAPPMDANYSAEDLAPETLATMEKDCADFREKAGEIFEAALQTGQVKYNSNGDDPTGYGKAGHDFWLSRNGHGAGFFDGDWPEPYGDILQKAAESFGECTLYAGDDGKLYLL